MNDFRSFLIYAAGAAVVVGAMVGVSYILGQRHRDRATGEAYESGILVTGDARVRFNARFYLVAMLFVVFDLESIFLYAWSVAAREAGWPGYRAILVFSVILLLALAYVWRMGGLNFGPEPGRHRGGIGR